MMAQARNKTVFDGVAKIKVVTGPRGVQIIADVEGPGAMALGRTLGLLIDKVREADDATLTEMAEEMCGFDKDE
jgi:hypothetical protein